MSIVSVVVGVDGTEPSDHALCFAVGLAAREGAWLSACFVSHPVIAYPVGIIAVDHQAYAAQLDQRVNDELERADVGGWFFHRDGDVVDELERLAEEWVADVIVVGRSRHRRLHLSSVPRRLLDGADHAVLVVP